MSLEQPINLPNPHYQNYLSDQVSDSLGFPSTQQGVKTAFEIQQELNSPYATLTKQAFADAVINLWIAEQIKEYQKYELLLIQQRREAAARAAQARSEKQPSSHSGTAAVDRNENPKPLEILTEEKEIAALEDKRKTLQNRLDKAVNNLKTLQQNRHDLVAPMIADWAKLQASQVDNLLQGMVIDSDEAPFHFALTEEDKSILKNVPKGPALELIAPRLTPPGEPPLIPPDASREQIDDKAYTNHAINYFRVAASHDPRTTGYNFVMAPPSPQINEGKTVNIYLQDDKLKYAVGGNSYDLKNLNVFYLDEIKKFLNPSSRLQPLSDEFNNAIYEAVGYFPVLRAGDVQRIKPTAIESWAPTLKPYFKEVRDQDDILFKEQAGKRQKVKNIDQEMQAQENEIRGIQAEMALLAQPAVRSTAPAPRPTLPGSTT